MKNFWLEHRGPAKTTINVWVCPTICDGEAEELLETSQIETNLLRSSAIIHAYISKENNEMLCDHRVGKAIGEKGLGADLSQNLKLKDGLDATIKEELDRVNKLAHNLECAAAIAKPALIAPQIGPNSVKL